jgi:hypothetical protein
MKKPLILLLLLTIVAGTFIPCCRIADCCKEDVANTTNHSNQKGEETCPPFFSCTSCSIFVELAKPILVTQPIIEKQVHQERIITFNLSAYSVSYWQPPRA